MIHLRFRSSRGKNSEACARFTGTATGTRGSRCVIRFQREISNRRVRFFFRDSRARSRGVRFVSRSATNHSVTLLRCETCRGRASAALLRPLHLSWMYRVFYTRHCFPGKPQYTTYRTLLKLCSITRASCLSLFSRNDARTIPGLHFLLLSP